MSTGNLQSQTPLTMGASGVELESPELEMLRRNKLDAYNYRYRKVFDWDENYELYRDKVLVNRLTQRQSVNLPLMKTAIKTLLKDIDDMPVIEFQSLDNDESAEIFYNEYWKFTVDYNRMELQDVVDKRQEFLFGRTYDQWQIVDGKVKMTVQDPYDILIQRYADPFNINSSRYLIHVHIFQPLSRLGDNPDYDNKAVENIKKWYATQMGLLKASENQRLLVQKNQRMADMGVPDTHSPVLGESWVELAMHFIFRPKGEKWNDPNTGETFTTDEEQVFLYVECDGMQILMKKPLEKIIGETKDHFWRNHYPYVSWADDVERQDWNSDGVADIIRVPNKVMNAWFSQMVENRSLKNLNMHIFDSSISDWQPQTWQPKAWGMYGIPVPANRALAEVFDTLKVDDLKDSLEEMNFLQSVIDKASGATPTQQGVSEGGEVTLGEVQLQLQNAKQRVKGMSKFYTQAWKDRGMIFLKLCEAAPEKLDAVKIYKRGKNSNDMFSREISPKDWITQTGYSMKVWSQDQKDAMDVDALNKLNAVKANIPNNPKLTEIYERKMLEFGGLNPEEVNAVMEIEMKKLESGDNNKPMPAESLTIPYQFAPPDIQAQIEQLFGLKPSASHQMGSSGQQPELPEAPNNNNQPVPTPQMPNLQARAGVKGVQGALPSVTPQA